MPARSATTCTIAHTHIPLSPLCLHTAFWNFTTDFLLLADRESNVACDPLNTLNGEICLEAELCYVRVWALLWLWWSGSVTYLLKVQSSCAYRRSERLHFQSACTNHLLSYQPSSECVYSVICLIVHCGVCMCACVRGDLWEILSSAVMQGFSPVFWSDAVHILWYVYEKHIFISPKDREIEMAWRKKEA